MIGQLVGFIIDEGEEDRCLVDVNGVGYVVYASSKTLSRLPQPPEQAKILIETIVRDDAILLYGFAERAERDWFRTLTTVQGVGVRMAISILSVLSVDELSHTIMSGDKASLTRVSGVGQRLALRILTELSGKIDHLMAESLSAPSATGGNTGPLSQFHQDALIALEGLGFKRIEAQPIVGRILRELSDEGQELQLNVIIKKALRELAR